MNIIYEFGLILLKLLYRIVSPFNKKAKLWLNGRKDLFKHIENTLDPDSFIIWIHVASLGEFEQARPLMEQLKKQEPECKLMLTFFSPSGYEAQNNYEFADYVFYLPLDTKRNANKLIKIVKPNIAIFVKYEFWYNHLKAIKENNIPLYLMSGIFRPSQAFFKWYGGWYKQILYMFSHFFVQNEESQKLLQDIGISSVSISGDTRFDRVYDIASKVQPIETIEKFCNNQLTIIFGSSWKADEELFFDFINNFGNNIKFIIAPHEVHESNINRIISNITKPAIRFTKIKENVANTEANVLIIDNIGILSSVYQYGSIACIGGGFGSGIHNILEAATFGLPVLFGPNYQKFQEAVDLIKLKGAFVINNKQEATETLKLLIEDKAKYKTCSNVCKDYVQHKRGATEIVLQYLTKEVKKQPHAF